VRGGLIALGGIVAIAAACSAPAPAAPSPADATPIVTEHFTFAAASADSALVQQYATALEGQFGRITSDLGVASMPRVTVNLYATHPQLETLRRLIANNADLEATLGLSPPEFERRWFAFTKQTYGF
jgi:hypothetical protein